MLNQEVESNSAFSTCKKDLFGLWTYSFPTQVKVISVLHSCVAWNTSEWA